MKRPSDEALDKAAQTYVDAVARRDSLSPHDAAVEAYVPGGPSVDELEARIREMRGMPSRTRPDLP